MLSYLSDPIENDAANARTDLTISGYQEKMAECAKIFRSNCINFSPTTVQNGPFLGWTLVS
jgi:hypothetical protein